ncbi:hypothetical protein FOZ76_17400 [Verticiella sediminum]|uniref:Uncharacterized protein n=1 Tax=Verticiella sediminum TaxID=1247510 RepID=A0A556AGX1_9BURK|nr:hypothetical protein [Verticiella sediminum]TSH92146.1 hypothetical protein FOZ76_17400 [Verticiella sediminum]
MPYVEASAPRPEDARRPGDGAVRRLRLKGGARPLPPAAVASSRCIHACCAASVAAERCAAPINYSSSGTRRIMRQPSGRIGEILGSGNAPELRHGDNLVVLPGKASS